MREDLALVLPVLILLATPISVTAYNHSNPPSTNGCASAWVSAGCDVWGDCKDGVQTRECKSFNQCDSSLNATIETRNCTTDGTTPTIHTSNTTGGQNEAQNTSDPLNASSDISSNNDTTNITHNLTNQTKNTTDVTAENPTGNTNETIPKSSNATTSWGSNPSINVNITVPVARPENESRIRDESETSNQTSEMISGVGKPNITRVYDTIEANGTAVVPIEKPEIAMRQIAVEVINRTTDVQITVMQLAEKPVEIRVDVAVRPEQRVYGYIEVNHTNLANENIKNASITFEVKKAWLRQNRINTSTVRLARYDDRWNEIATILINETEDSVYYEAESPGLSIFAIVGEQMLQYTGSVCVPLDRRCAGNMLQECKMDGSAWDKVKDCEFACRIDRCLNATEAKEGSQEEKAESTYFMIVIGLLVLILALGIMASHFRNKAKWKMVELERGHIM